MRFGNPDVLWLLALWPVLAWLGWRALQWRATASARLGNPALIERLYPASARVWRGRRLALGLAATALLTIAAARPQYGRIERSIHSYGTNVLIGLDCSRSMLARDVQPSRLESARGSFAWFLRSLQGNRVGVMAFAGDAVLNCPMTLDTEMALRVLDALDTETVGVPGTDLGRAIEVAIGAFERGAGAGTRALVLITDGEDQEGGALAAARRAAEKRIVIDAIGIGSDRGAPLLTEQGGFQEDAQGNKVNTRLRMDTLKEIAQATGGQAYAVAGDPRAAIDQIVARIDRLQKSELELRKLVIYQDRFPWLLAPALGLLIWMLLLRPEPAPPRTRSASGKDRSQPLAPGTPPAADRISVQ